MSTHPRLPKLFVVLLWMALTAGGASVVAVGPPRAPGHPSATAPDDDFDGDGIVNAMDNCLVGANADQRDRDHDEIGDGCDADFNDDGVVDAQDIAALAQAIGTDAPDKDLNGDGVVDARDLKIALELRRAPGPRLDSDGDGVADLEDPCPAASKGIPSIVPGCTALALVQQPAAVLDPLALKTLRLADDLRAAPEMLEVQRDLEAVAVDLADAERIIRGGGVCGSSIPFGDADRLIGLALDAIARQLNDARAAVRAGGGSTAPVLDSAGDVSEGDLLVAWLEYWQEQFGSLRASIRFDAAAFAGVCAATHTDTTRGVIQTLDDSQRQIVLTDGRTFGLADPIMLTGDVYEGRAVQLGGLAFDDGNGSATTLEAFGAAPSLPPLSVVPCMHLRFAPVQRFPPMFSGPFVLHDPLGYNFDDVYTVEAGMRVSVTSTCSPGPGGKFFPRHSLKVEISYQQAKTGAAIDHALMAAELTPGDDPVPFPGDIDPAVATLHVTSEVRSCTHAGPSVQCGDPTGVVTDYPLIVRARGDLAVALYDQTHLDVNDQKSGDFRFTHVSLAFALVEEDLGTSETFVAEGYGPFFDGLIEGQVVDSDPFAIRNTDFYPVLPAFTLAELYSEALASLLGGIDHAAGLRWPRVQGVRNGHAFWFSASLPVIVRDVVNFCAFPNAFYRLPFEEGFGFVQGQGNHPELKSSDPCCTHAGGFAYDMLAALDTPIRAARTGRVVKIQESLTVQCAPGQCNPNNVFIRHQDGSIGEYVHMPQNSVIPEVGDIVHRGQQIAVVGVVGPSSGPHLHFATRTQPKPGGTTFLAKFEAVRIVLGSPFPLLETCYEPQQGDLLISNNKTIP